MTGRQRAIVMNLGELLDNPGQKLCHLSALFSEHFVLLLAALLLAAAALLVLVAGIEQIGRRSGRVFFEDSRLSYERRDLS
jgi:hypothetical protein